jgi:hypothetical protein
MLVVDALFDHFRQISSNVEIIGSLVRCSPISASGRPSWVKSDDFAMPALLPLYPRACAMGYQAPSAGASQVSRWLRRRLKEPGRQGQGGRGRTAPRSH